MEKINFTVDGKALTEFRAQHVVLDYQINAIPSATLELAIPGGNRQAFLKSADISTCQPGAKIVIQIGGKNAFSGVITGSRLKLTRNPALELTLRHPLIAADSLNCSTVFCDKTDADILQALCKPVCSVAVKAEMNTKQQQKVQYQCSDWQMVRYILDQNGAWLLPLEEGVVVVKPEPAAQPHHSLSGKALDNKGRLLLDNVECQLNALNQPEELELAGWDIKQQTSLNVAATRATLGDGLLGSTLKKSLGQKKWQINYSSSAEQNKLKSQADSLLMNLSLTHVQAKFIVPGSLNYQPGQTLAVRDFGKALDGKGMITAIRHTLNKTIWRTEIRLGRSELLPSQVSLPLPDGVHIGVVQPFKEDQQDFGRFQVSLPVLGKKNNVLWARFAQPYASKNSGFICYPEPGDEVVVSFFDGQADYPVIIGSMYNPKNTAPLAADKDNAVKGLIINKENNQIQFNTSKEQVTLHDGITLKADDNNQLVLNKNAELKGSSVTVQGSSIDLKKG
jgi:uncharacterized protein involved in type VI secretion and phage assembly